jgi:hypothetical protein
MNAHAPTDMETLAPHVLQMVQNHATLATASPTKLAANAFLVKPVHILMAVVSASQTSVCAMVAQQQLGKTVLKMGAHCALLAPQTTFKPKLLASVRLNGTWTNLGNAKHIQVALQYLIVSMSKLRKLIVHMTAPSMISNAATKSVSHGRIQSSILSPRRHGGLLQCRATRRCSILCLCP